MQEMGKDAADTKQRSQSQEAALRADLAGEQQSRAAAQEEVVQLRRWILDLGSMPCCVQGALLTLSGPDASLLVPGMPAPAVQHVQLHACGSMLESSLVDPGTIHFRCIMPC